jgi:hypothetical protein
MARAQESIKQKECFESQIYDVCSYKFIKTVDCLKILGY